MNSTGFNPPAPSKDPKKRPDGRNRGAEVAINALSRVLAVLVLGAAIAGLGALLDSWLGTNYWMLIGIVLGTLLAIPGLFLVAKVSELDVQRASDSTGQSAGQSTGQSTGQSGQAKGS